MKLGAFLAAHAAGSPDKIAVRCGADTITFRELDEAGDRLADALGNLGLVPGDRVALFLPSCIAFVQCFAAAVKAGFVCVPISNRLTDAEVAVILDDCRPRAIVFNGDTRAPFAAAAASAPGILRVACDTARGDELSLETLIASGAPGPRAALPVEIDDCMICYTSGTTGRPKGAIITHANVAVLNGFVQRCQLGLTPNDVLLATTSIGLRTGFNPHQRQSLRSYDCYQPSPGGVAEAVFFHSQDITQALRQQTGIDALFFRLIKPVDCQD